MHEYKKLYTLLRIIALLSESTGYTVPQLAKKYELSKRTIYRYLDLLKNCGFSFDKDINNRYRINKPGEAFLNEGVFFSLEESSIIKDAILAIHNTHPLRNNILSKLFAFSELNNTAELIYDQLLAKKIAALTRAISDKRQVVLKGYHSLNSNSIADRLVEPVSFVHNMRYFTAFEPETHEVRLFKPDRAGDVKVLDKEFAHESLHTATHPDAFGMKGNEETKVELKLSPRAANLLSEELPLAAEGIEDSGPSDFSYWNGKVKGFEGVGRFIMGLPGEVEVVAPPELAVYVREKMKNYRHTLRQDNKDYPETSHKYRK